MLPYSIDWSQVGSISEVAQVIDGNWGLTVQGVRPLELGYDRLIGIGDLTWQDYEVTVPITLHSFRDDINLTRYSPAIGFVMRWQGHYLWNPDRQPAYGWYPLGALGQYVLTDGGARRELQILNNTVPIASDPTFDLQLNVTYMWKMRCVTVSPGRTGYSLKVWQQGTPEPSTWDLYAERDSSTLDYGSLALMAHHADATFGNVTVTPL